MNSKLNLQDGEPLRRYSAEAIARYYNRRLWLVIWRGGKIFFAFAFFVIRLLFDKWFNQEEKIS